MHTGWQRAARQAGMRTAVPAAVVLPSLLLASCVFVLVCARARAFVGACAAVYTHAVPADGMHARWAGWGNGPKNGMLDGRRQALHYHNDQHSQWSITVNCRSLG